MKTLASVFGLILFAQTITMAQHAWSGDPGYNANNYKHPNKAAVASKSEKSPQSSSALALMGKSNRDYKKVNDSAIEKQIRLDYNKTQAEITQVRNHKMPYTPFQSSVTDKELAIKSDTGDKN